MRAVRAVAVTGTILAVGALTTNVARPTPKVGLTPHASGLVAPTDIASAGDDRLFVAEQRGVVRIVEADGSISGTFLDITDRVRASGGEEGLLGLVFPPDYGVTGTFFVYYTRHDGDNQLSSFRAVDRSQADPASETPVLTIPHPVFTNHNGGDLDFGPDGFLYVSTGDGGGAGDPNDNAQDRESLLGKILRLDVRGDDFPGDPSRNYAAPSTNPFVGSPGADEVWALGLRNPWRFSFDGASGAMYIGDVGQQTREEIDFEPGGSSGGSNYGWSCYEGSVAFDPSSCSGEAGLVFPVAEYENEGDRCAVTGGYVYRGDEHPQLRGSYFYIDFCSGELFTLKSHARKGIAGHAKSLGTFDVNISSFGQSSTGELYAADLVSGVIYRLDGRP